MDVADSFENIFKQRFLPNSYVSYHGFEMVSKF